LSIFSAKKNKIKIKDSGKREWNYVLVYKLDHFSRDKYATAIHKKTLKDNGVKLLSTPFGVLRVGYSATLMIPLTYA
jgi:hypothetical protein